jgi:hypothetical protein
MAMDRREVLHHRIFDAARRMNLKLQISVAARNRTYVHMTFLTGNDLMNKIMKCLLGTLHKSSNHIPTRGKH